jgi:DNA-binding Lrp family transcriptional regulator
MLHDFLKAVRDGEVQSVQEIARSLNISPAMGLRMAQDLAARGYLQEIGVDCNSPQGACLDCPAVQGCQALTRHWFLTEKGKTAASAAASAE